MKFPDAIPCGSELEVRQKRPLVVLLLNATGTHSRLSLLEAFVVITAIERSL